MMVKHSIKKVLLIDIPTYKVELPELHRSLIEKRLRVQTILWQKRTGIRMFRPGLTYSRGLLSIAACLEQHGFLVKYLIYSDPLDRVRILDFAKESDAVCVTAMTPALHIATALCDAIKKAQSEVITILGGPHISSRPVETLRKYASVDFVMIGECEYRLPALLMSIEKPDTIEGIAYRLTNEEVQISSINIDSVIVSELPLPAYHLLSRPLSEYAHNIKTVRGCPYNCNFCVERLSWNSIQSSENNPQQVFDEIKFLSDRVHPGTLIHFSDSIFNLQWDRTAEIIDLIKRGNLNLVYSFDTRVDLVEESQIEALAEAGFIYIRMGFESVHNDILRMAEKSSTREKERRASQIIRNTSKKIAIHAYMLTGLPGSSSHSLSSDVIDIREMIRNDLVDIVGNKILVPYPGTPYYDLASRLGIQIQTNDWSKYDRRSYPVYRLENLSADEIYFGYLHQEATLIKAYQEKLGDSEFTIDDINAGLDYLYRNYAEQDVPS